MRILACFLVLSALMSAALAAPDDLSPHSAAWHGTSALLADIIAAADTVEASTQLDLSALPQGAGLVLLDSALDDTRGLIRFVQDGGRLLVTAEDTAASPLLTALHLRAIEAPTDGPRLGDHPALPVIRSAGRGVFTGAQTLVTNHPIALEGAEDLTPAVRFPSGAGFAFHLTVGAGEVLVLADASVLTNQMRGAGDNARLSQNIATWISEGRRPVFLGWPGATVQGVYGAPLIQRRAALNQRLTALADRLAPGRLGLLLLLALLLASALFYALGVFPGDRGRTPIERGHRADTSSVERVAGAPDGPGAPDTYEPLEDPTR